MVVCHRDVMERSFHECYSHYESTCKNNLHLNGQQMVVGSHSVFYVGNASIQRKSRYECVCTGAFFPSPISAKFINYPYFLSFSFCLGPPHFDHAAFTHHALCILCG